MVKFRHFHADLFATANLVCIPTKFIQLRGKSSRCALTASCFICINFPVQGFGDGGGNCVCVTCQMVLHVLSTWPCCFSQIAPGSMTSKTTTALASTSKKSCKQDQDMIPATCNHPMIHKYMHACENTYACNVQTYIYTVYDTISHQGVVRDMK